MKERFRQFMAGRYGVDALGRALNIPALILLAVGIFTVPIVSIAGAAVVGYSYFRVFSRNRTARLRENTWYLKQKNNAQKRFTQRKTHKFFTCASCKKTVRVPKGKGEIEITCPVCHNRFTRRT